MICDNRDFGIGRRVCAKNWSALGAVGESANRRLSDAEAVDAMPAPDLGTSMRWPDRPRPKTVSMHQDFVSAIPGVMAVLGALVGFCHLFRGFTNGQLVRHIRALLDGPYSGQQATYDLRRLKRKGLIARIPRYQLTPRGRRVAVLFTKVYARVFATGLTALDLQLPK